MNLLFYPYEDEYETIQSALERYPEYLQTASVQEYLDSVQPAVVCIGSDIFLFEPITQGAAKGHFFCLSKGRRAIQSGGEALASAMGHFNLVVGLTPIHNKAARWFSRQLGFKSYGILDGPTGRVEVFSITKKEWEERNGRTIR